MVIFDWDDTLLPTWYIRSVVEPCSAADSNSDLSPDSPFYSTLRQHSELVATTLRAARALGRVAIVTLSRRGWVHDSAARFLPGLDLQELLDELHIPIYYAAEHVRSSVARLAQSGEGLVQMFREGVDVLAACKRGAVEQCLRDVCGRRKRLQLNVMSVGDSQVERNAVKDALWSPKMAHLPAGEHLCKTVKLLEDPTLQQLGDQLRLLEEWLPNMAARGEDFDFDM